MTRIRRKATADRYQVTWRELNGVRYAMLKTLPEAEKVAASIKYSPYVRIYKFTKGEVEKVLISQT